MNEFRECLAVLLLCLTVSHAASALTLYRYVDATGRMVVVGDLEKVPEEFRRSVDIETIGEAPPSRKVEEPEAAGLSDASLEEVPASDTPQEDVSKQPLPDETGSASVKTASEAEMPDYAHASATLWLKTMQDIHRRNEEIWYVANAFTPYHRRILALQEENLRALDQLREFEGMTWKDHQEWVDRARGMTDQLRQLSFSVSMWLRQTPERIKQELPPLLNRFTMVLDMTASTLPAAETGR